MGANVARQGHSVLVSPLAPLLRGTQLMATVTVTLMGCLARMAGARWSGVLVYSLPPIIRHRGGGTGT